jgi:hypothetical protein
MALEGKGEEDEAPQGKAEEVELEGGQAEGKPLKGYLHGRKEAGRQKDKEKAFFHG